MRSKIGDPKSPQPKRSFSYAELLARWESYKSMKLTDTGKREVMRSLQDSQARLERRVEKLTVDLESIQWELNDLRNIQGALRAALELLEAGER